MSRSLILSIRGESRGRREYLLAARRVACDSALGPLAAFAVPASATRVPAPPRVAPGGPPGATYRRQGWVGGRLVDVSCRRTGGVLVVEIGGEPPVAVGRTGCALLAGAGVGAISPALEEALLGPCLLLALAHGGTFALHAAAVRAGAGAALLVGASGAGKSTLARALAAAGSPRLADDVLPCEANGGSLDALPHYPQLKLAPAEQYAAGRPPRVPVVAIYLLDGVPPAEADGPATFAALAPRDALVTIAAHTVAARLFDAPLLESHLAFCDAAAAAVPVRRVRFPRRLEALPELAAAVAADAAALAGAPRRAGRGHPARALPTKPTVGT